MTRTAKVLLAALFLALLAAPPLAAAEFKLANGSVLRGELASADEDGLVVRLDIGGFSKREAWINFSQETLKQLAADPKIVAYVEPFIELDPEELRAKDKQKEITVRDVPDRQERPSRRPSLVAGFLTPVGLLLLVALWAGNLYAGYEVARFRQQPVALVCGLAAILPILGPILFLSLPTRVEYSAAPAELAAAEAAAPSSSFNTPANMPGGGSSLSLASQKSEGASGAPTVPQTFARGDTTFNRRWFETKFPGFFRLVPSEAEKDLVLAIKCVRAEYVAKRISRISSNEMHVLVLAGGEVMVPFAEITSVTLRHKDAKG